MDSSGLIIIMILCCLSLIFLMLMAKPLKYILKFIINAVVGVAGILILNFVLQPIGVSVGLNILSAAFIGLLGIPGFGAIVLINALL